MSHVRWTTCAPGCCNSGIAMSCHPHCLVPSEVRGNGHSLHVHEGVPVEAIGERSLQVHVGVQQEAVEVREKVHGSHEVGAQRVLETSKVSQTPVGQVCRRSTWGPVHLPFRPRDHVVVLHVQPLAFLRSSKIHPQGAGSRWAPRHGACPHPAKKFEAGETTHRSTPAYKEEGSLERGSGANSCESIAQQESLKRRGAFPSQNNELKGSASDRFGESMAIEHASAQRSKCLSQRKIDTRGTWICTMPVTCPNSKTIKARETQTLCPSMPQLHLQSKREDGTCEPCYG